MVPHSDSSDIGGYLHIRIRDKMLSQVFVRTLQGTSFPLSVSGDDTVLSVKRKIQNKENIPAMEQRLIYSGKQLDDERTLSDYKIENDATLHLLLRLKGGQ